MISPGSMAVNRTRNLLAGVIVGVLALASGGRAADDPPRATPLSGIVRAGDATLGGVTLVVRFVTKGEETTTRILKTEGDGTFVIPSAPPGLYTLLAAAPGLPFAVVRVFHSSAPDSVSFVPIDFASSTGLLPSSRLGAGDPWNARAAAKGDVLREVTAILAALDEAPQEAPPLPAATKGTAIATRVPVHASLASMAGFGGSGGPTVNETALDVSGSLGGNLRWGVDGRYSRLGPAEGLAAGDASRLALDLSAGDTQNLRLATRRQVQILDESDVSRFSAHSLDWSAITGLHSQASVSARLVTQTNAFGQGPAADLFARASDTVDVYAGYRTDFDERFSVRVNAAYRHAAAPESLPTVEMIQQEARLGAVGGARLLPVLSLEAGATGDFSALSRGIMPEVTVTLEPLSRFRFQLSAARRFERRFEDGTPAGQVSADLTDLARITGSLYRGGVRWDGPSGEAVVVEASRREITGIQRLLLDPDFFDRLDSLYFLPGDVATEIHSTLSGQVASNLSARLSARIGRVAGEAESAIRNDDTSWGLAEAGLHVGATGTTIGFGYRFVQQTLVRGEQALRNDLAALDVSVSQNLPIPLLRDVASDWRALVSVEFGKRRNGEEPERANRRLAGGLAVSF